jgi:hypothetical protein
VTETGAGAADFFSAPAFAAPLSFLPADVSFDFSEDFFALEEASFGFAAFVPFEDLSFGLEGFSFV